MPDADDFDLEELRRLVRGEGSCKQPASPCAPEPEVPAARKAGPKKVVAAKARGRKKAAVKLAPAPAEPGKAAPATSRRRRRG